jgi:hypothetical protein
MEQYLEGFLLSAWDLLWQVPQRSPVVVYLLLYCLDGVAEILLSELHRLMLDHLLGLLDTPA